MSAPDYVHQLRDALEGTCADPEVVDSELLRELLVLDAPMNGLSMDNSDPNEPRWVDLIGRCQEMVNASRT